MTKKKNKNANPNLAHLQVTPAEPRPKLAKELNHACPLAFIVVLLYVLTNLILIP